MESGDYTSVLKQAKQGITKYLQEAREAGRIDQQLFDVANENTYRNLEKWLTFPSIPGISDGYKKGIAGRVEQEKWKELVDAFRQEVRFGTGGIRGMMAFDKESIVKMKDEGVGASILKGPNTINDLVFSLTTAGVAKFGKDQSPALQKVVVGYDSRIRGFDFAKVVARVFLGYGYEVYFFDAPCPYPEVTFAIPHESIKADIGVLISASHNDYRYNGYKLSCANGSQFDPEERDDMYNNYIATATIDDIKVCEFENAQADKLFFLGGDKPVEGFSYDGREKSIINMHQFHREHIQKFLMTENLAESQRTKDGSAVKIGFCAFHGAGIEAVPRLLTDVGFPQSNIMSIDGTAKGRGLNELNGLFPAFCSDPGREQQPDPGDPRAADTAVTAFKEDYPDQFKDVDIVIGTDPDADRCGVVVKIPPDQQKVYDGKDYRLLPSDDMWALVLWYRLHNSRDAQGKVKSADKKFIVLSHTTSDGNIFLARKAGLGVVKTWVGFAALAAATRDVWTNQYDDYIELTDGRSKKYSDLCHPFICECYDMKGFNRSINEAAMEQSNGFSLLGGPPPDGRSLGVDGHVRDKDGTLAALLVAEIAAWAKNRGTTIVELVDKHIYLDPEVGMFTTFYEPDPLDGEYPGIEGDRLKKEILLRALDLYKKAQSGGVEIGGNPVKSAVIYRTGKYDAIYPPTKDFQFPDEGIRMFFDDEKLQHVTIRPSGTGNSLRFHIQLRALPTKENLIATKAEERKRGAAIMDDLRVKLGAPRS